MGSFRWLRMQSASGRLPCFTYGPCADGAMPAEYLITDRHLVNPISLPHSFQPPHASRRASKLFTLSVAILPPTIRIKLYAIHVNLHSLPFILLSHRLTPLLLILYYTCQLLLMALKAKFETTLLQQTDAFSLSFCIKLAPRGGRTAFVYRSKAEIYAPINIFRLTQIIALFIFLVDWFYPKCGSFFTAACRETRFL